MKKNNTIFSNNSKLIDSYENNLTEFNKKNIQAIYLPTNIEELKEVVSNAKQEKTDIYIISTGKNWGLGSKQPVISNSSVVDLSKMNKIVEVNERFRYAIIEPGVTQNDLAEFLQKNHPHLKLPVTGSAKGTSIMGNMLERGAVAFEHRNNMLVAMEVLLSNGDIIKTGLWHYFEDNNPLAFHYANGHGPDLKGLFIQSNLGIVTKIVVRLQPQNPGVIVAIKFKEDALGAVTDDLRNLYEQNLLDNGIVITNLNDPRTTKNRQYEYNGEWLGVGSFSGPKQLLKSKRKILTKALSKLNADFFFLSTDDNPFGLNKSILIPYLLNIIQNNKFLFRYLSKKKLKTGDTLGELLNRFDILKDFYKGQPSNYSIETMAQMNDTILEEEDLDNSTILGLTVALPAVPIDGKSTVEVSNIVNEVSKKWNVAPFHNFASIDELTFEGFYRIYFDRTDKEAVDIAHKWSLDLHLELKEKHYYPYRIDNETMEHFVSDADPFWNTLGKIKKTLDESNIIAKGKYNVKS